MSKPSSPSSSRLSLRKKLLFSLLVLSVFLLVVEGISRVTGFGHEESPKDPFVEFESGKSIFVEIEPGVYQTRPEKLTWFNEQTFELPKPPASKRIFCLGGSTTYGRPYDHRTSFCAWLQEYLNHSDDPPWEVINAGGISYASYRVSHVLEEVLEYDPDLMVVYTGHNEFLEERSYGEIKDMSPLIRSSNRLIGHSQFLRGVQSIVRPSVESSEEFVDEKKSVISSEVRAKLDNAIGPADYHRDEEWAVGILVHYEYHLRHMVESCRQANVPLILVVPASNLRDFSPFKSEFSDTTTFEAQSEIERMLEETKESELTTRIENLERAKELDPLYAETRYRLGKAYWEQEQYETATSEFIAARDEDVCPLRAPSQFLEVVRKVARETKTPVVDFERVLKDRSAHSCPGEEWFLDHVHPTIEGHRLLAEAILKEFPLAVKIPDENATASVRKTIESRIDDEMRGRSLINLSKVLGWAGRREESAALALKGVQLLPDDSEALYQTGNAHYERGELDQAEQFYRQSLALNPESAAAFYGLGNIAMGRKEYGNAVRYFQKAIGLKPDFGDAYYNLGTAYYAQNQIEPAVHHLERSLELEPSNPYACNTLGAIAANRGDLETAKSWFEQSIEIAPNVPDGHVNLIRLSLELGELERVRAECRIVLRLVPNHPYATKVLSQMNQQE